MLDFIEYSEKKHNDDILARWISLFKTLQFSNDTIHNLIEKIKENKESLLAEKFVDYVNKNDIFQAIAQEFGVEYKIHIEPEKLQITKEECIPLLQKKQTQTLPFGCSHHPNEVLIGLYILDLDFLQKQKERAQKENFKLSITSYETMRAGIFILAQSVLKDRSLLTLDPQYSALRTLTKKQSFFAGFFICCLSILLVTNITFCLFLLHFLSSFFFLGCGLLKFTAAQSIKRKKIPKYLKNKQETEKPIYSILIPLRNEADIVPQLLEALNQIVWPQDKLEIKLICEEDDLETLKALRLQELGSHVEIIEVPEYEPRTKPKALNYALPCTTGEFLVVYDAEDRPHPLQLLEAWHYFCHTDENVVCLQAPLEIRNAKNSFIARMFAFEYISLFRGLLPYLAEKKLWLPLGGTSNHFYRSILEKVGGWDSYNVTEDADLSMRLARMGYRIETIGYPTYEDAPQAYGVWKRQRARWLKGWMQCWFVHMRKPRKLYKEIKFLSFLIWQFFSLGTFLSAAVHLFFIPTMIMFFYSFCTQDESSFWVIFLLCLDSISIFFSYVGFLYLGWSQSKLDERKHFWIIILGKPIYWSMISLAAWTAIKQLATQPHYWNKTPHTPSWLLERTSCKSSKKRFFS